jgi:hypothetical protein
VSNIINKNGGNVNQKWREIMLSFFGEFFDVSPIKESLRGFLGSTSFSKKVLVIFSSASFGGLGP